MFEAYEHEALQNAKEEMKSKKLQFPIYRKYDNQYFRLNSYTNVVSIRVDNIVRGVGISDVSEDVFANIYLFKECNSAEFNTILKSIMNELNQQAEQVS